MSEERKEPQFEKPLAADAGASRRERAIEQMLAQRADGHASDRECPDAEMIAAYMDHTLDDAETAQCEHHFAECARCQDLLAALTVSEPEEADAPAMAAAAEIASAPTRGVAAGDDFAPAAPRRPFWQWLVPLAVATAALLFWFDFRQKPASQPELTQTAARIPAETAPSTPPPSGGSPAAPDAATTATGNAISKDGDVSKSSTTSRREVAKQKLDARRPAATAEAKAPAAPMSAAVRDAIANGPALERSAVSDTLPTPLPLPGAQPQSVVGGRNDKKEAADRLQAQAENFRAADSTAAPQIPQSVAANSPNGILGGESRAMQKSARASGMFGGIAGAAESFIIVSPTNGNMVWRIGQHGRIERSSDSGQTWIPCPSGVTADLLAGAAPGNNVAWVAGASGTILRTTDAGATWSHLKSPAVGANQAPDWASVSATDRNHATISTITGESFSTTDGGTTWSPKQ
jgi:hypothetical protein